MAKRKYDPDVLKPIHSNELFPANDKGAFFLIRDSGDASAKMEELIGHVTKEGAERHRKELTTKDGIRRRVEWQPWPDEQEIEKQCAVDLQKIKAEVTAIHPQPPEQRGDS